MPRSFRALLLAGTLAAITAPASSTELPADTTAFIQEAIDNGDLTGVVVVLVEGDAVVTRGFGLASTETGKAPDADSVFQIGSITKTFTGALLADAVLSGKMTLSDPVQAYLPAGVTIAQVGERPMTIEDLATHRSGLPRLEPDFAPADPADPYADIDEAKLWRTVSNVQPARAPGAAFEYSNLGYGLLGALIARAQGKSYADLVAEKIFTPLGMAHSSARLPDALRAQAAQGYGSDGAPVPFWTFDAVPGLGAINSTAKDMTAYLRASMAAAAGRAEETPLGHALTLALTPRADVAAPGGPRIGFAWVSPPDGRLAMHDGGTYGFSSQIAFRTDGSRGVLVLANRLQTEMVSGIGNHLLDPAAPLPRIVKTVTLPPDTLAHYAGTYSMGPALTATVSREGEAGLSIQIAGQPAAPVFASAPDRFFYRGLPVTVDFDRDGQGQVVRLVFHQMGQRYRVPRLDAQGKPLPQPARLTPDAATLDGYVGAYRIGPGAQLMVTRDGDLLMAQLPGQPAAAALFSEQPDHFEFEINDVDLLFERDAAGKVVSVTARSGGHESRAARVEPSGAD